MKVSDYAYDLPEALIASKPAAARGMSRLLVINKDSDALEDSRYSRLADYFNPGDLLILNDTRVIKARLLATNENGSPRELIILEKHGHSDNWHVHKVMYRRTLHAGDRLSIGNAEIDVDQILGDGLAIVKSSINLLDITEQFGQVPLPPYMRRAATPSDIERYQTVWARDKGSVAAPTASLNMTEIILQSLREKGIQIAYLTLHVGLGTFMPIRSEDVENHHMHAEYFEIPASTVTAVQTAKKAGNRVVAIGTTVARTLEFAADMLQQPPHDISGEADIYIYPGYSFNVVDGLLTNFHAPKSTVLMLTAAFAGWGRLHAAYQHAIAQRYRFLSYGDSMLII